MIPIAPESLNELNKKVIVLRTDVVWRSCVER